jgi:hypothetical protein
LIFCSLSQAISWRQPFGRIAKTFGAPLSPGGNLDVEPNLLQI